jgi:hypothetical protein
MYYYVALERINSAAYPAPFVKHTIIHTAVSVCILKHCWKSSVKYPYVYCSNVVYYLQPPFPCCETQFFVIDQ